MDTPNSVCQCDGKHAFDIGAAGPWGISGTLNAQAYGCQEWQRMNIILGSPLIVPFTQQ